MQPAATRTGRSFRCSDRPRYLRPAVSKLTHSRFCRIPCAPLPGSFRDPIHFWQPPMQSSGYDQVRYAPLGFPLFPRVVHIFHTLFHIVLC